MHAKRGKKSIDIKDGSCRLIRVYLYCHNVSDNISIFKSFSLPQVSSELDSQKWHFVLLTWSVQDGLILFIDGPRKAQNSQSMSFQLKPVATSKHIILGRCNAEMGATFAAFSSDMVALFDSVTPDGKVYLSYSFSGTNLDD